MPRPWRVEFAGACYHVINRGNYQRDLFTGKGAANAFERTLEEAATRFGWLIHAYVVMSNHFHLGLELGEPNLSEGMKWLQGTWIRRYNGYRRLVGRPFQGRHKAILVESGPSFGRVCHYIHLNPVRARLVDPGSILRYPWSSLLRFVSGSYPRWLDSTTVLGQAGNLSDSAEGWSGYLQHLRFLAEDPESQRTLASEKLSRGWCVGSPAFKEEIRTRHALRGAVLERFAGLEPAKVAAERCLVWREQLQRIARVAGVDLTCLPPLKSDPQKALLAAALKASTSASNRWLASTLQLGSPSSVSQVIGRFLHSEGGRRRMQELVSNVLT